MANKTAHKSSGKKEEAPIVAPPGTEGPTLEQLEPLDKGTKRAFQTGPEPGQREMLTKAEAQKLGFHWAETEEEGKKKKG